MKQNETDNRFFAASTIIEKITIINNADNNKAISSLSLEIYY